MSRNIHIGFGDSATDCILEAIKDHSLPGNGAVPSRDDFTQGPISECILDFNERIKYWESVDEVLKFGDDIKTFYIESIKILDELETDKVTIWIGDSCHDILASGWLLLYLKEKIFNWDIVNLASVHKEDLPDGLPPVNLAMYAPQNIPKLYKYRKPLDEIAKNNLITTWKKVAHENSQYRIQEGDSIISVNGDYFDEYILSHIHTEFEPTSKVVGRILHDGQHRISDTTVEWNIRKLIRRNQIDFHGNFGSMKTYNIKKGTSSI